jgi:CRISPR-associated endonuclease/helicase Cas3
MSELLAKSNPKHTLLKHTYEVMDAAHLLFGTPENPVRLGGEWLRFFKLAPDQYGAFALALRASAAWHDIGKATSTFQDAILHRKAQLLRHEHLSGMLLATDSVQSWLDTRAELRPLKDFVLSAVLTHHLKLRDAAALAPMPAEPMSFELYVAHDDFRKLMRMIGECLSLSGAPPTFEQIWRFDTEGLGFCLSGLRDQIGKRLKQFERRLGREPELARLNRAIRAALIAADAAASGLTRMGHDYRTWLAAAFDEAQLCDELSVCDTVIKSRVDQIRQTGKWHGWSQFQDNAALLPGRALLLEPCGSGKTLAAWRWIASRLKERRAARVLFLYPTRATATEGFRDYVSFASEDDAALMHGTAEYDLDGMFETPEENPSNPDERQKKQYEVEAKMFALGFWTKRLFSATVDQFLAFMQHSYGPMCMLPVLADSVVVIDEVHSFDHAMFSTLKEFLTAFDVPVLCMTATLPEERRQQLLECGLKQPATERPDDLRKAADAPRYRIRRVATIEVAKKRIDAALQEGRRVLWVVNQVRRAQVALQGGWRASVRRICYHGRFRMCDRRDRHREVVAAFQGETAPVLAATTQVCEMSLDLDADLLVTEECPITSLIQRMGRSNRKGIRAWGGEILVYKPEDPKPYDREVLAGLEEFLVEVATGSDALDISQTHLENALLRHGPKLGQPDRWCSFLGSGPYAQGGDESFRDIEEYTVPALLEEDVAEYLRLQQAREPTAGLIVPVPRRFGHPAREFDSRLPKFLAVASGAHYDPLTGFWDAPLLLEGGKSS